MTKSLLAAIVSLACIAAPALAQTKAKGKAADAKAAQAKVEKEHDELRALLATFTKSFNSGDVDPLVPHLHKDFTVTMVNQDVVTSPKELKGYLDKMLRSSASPLKEVKIAPEPDIKTVFINGPVGINRGGSVDTYTLKDGRVYTLKTRWTGTVVKEDGKWKLLNAHIGLNMLDNPILDAVEGLKYMWGAGGLVIGLLVGAGGVLLLRRRKPAA